MISEETYALKKAEFRINRVSDHENNNYETLLIFKNEIGFGIGSASNARKIVNEFPNMLNKK
jgi:hypothetical protein